MRILWLVLVAVALTTPVLSQDSAEDDSPTPQEDSVDSSEDPVSDEDFIPTEEIPADKEVTFPADI